MFPKMDTNITNFMKIQRMEIDDKGKFFIEENGGQIALMTYKKSSDGIITIDHTEVDPNFRGEGFGKDLVAEAVKFARENDLKIVATCPYAKKIIDKTPEFQDILAESN